MRYQNSEKLIKFEQEQLDFINELNERTDKELRRAGISEISRRRCLELYEEKTEKLKLDILRKIKHNMQIIEDITSAINALENDDYRMILTYKYINGYTYDEIEEKTYICRTNLFQYHAKALNLLQPIINNKNRSENIN